MKKLIILFAAAATACGVFAGPRGCGPCPPPPPPHFHHGYHGDGWGRGGCNFWPGFVGGVVGGVVGGAVAASVVREPVVVTTPVVTTPVVTTPVVVQQPVVVSQPAAVVAPVTQVQNVWVEGRYVDQVQANGSVVRTWQPGHYEQRTVVVQ